MVIKKIFLLCVIFVTTNLYADGKCGYVGSLINNKNIVGEDISQSIGNVKITIDCRVVFIKNKPLEAKVNNLLKLYEDLVLNIKNEFSKLENSPKKNIVNTIHSQISNGNIDDALNTLYGHPDVLDQSQQEFKDISDHLYGFIYASLIDEKRSKRINKYYSRCTRNDCIFKHELRGLLDTVKRQEKYSIAFVYYGESKFTTNVNTVYEHISSGCSNSFSLEQISYKEAEEIKRCISERFDLQLHFPTREQLSYHLKLRSGEFIFVRHENGGNAHQGEVELFLPVQRGRRFWRARGSKIEKVNLLFTTTIGD